MYKRKSMSSASKGSRSKPANRPRPRRAPERPGTGPSDGGPTIQDGPSDGGPTMERTARSRAGSNKPKFPSSSSMGKRNASQKNKKKKTKIGDVRMMGYMSRRNGS